MAIIQEKFDIPENIMTGLITGEYKKEGGVIRCAKGSNKGQIVKFLDPIEENEEKVNKNFISKSWNIVKSHPIGTVIFIGVLGGVTIYKKYKNKNLVVLKEFKSVLGKYINAIKNGRLNLEIIEDMEAALESLKKHKDYKKFYIQLNAEEIEVLVNGIYDYTIKLAKDNSIIIEDFKENDSDDAIINFERYLKVQKQIFKEAA